VRTRFVLPALVLALVLSGAACASDDSTGDASTAATVGQAPPTIAEPPTTFATSSVPRTDVPETTEIAVEPLRILVTNDDGVSAPGIDALVNALRQLPDVDVTVVAPAENQSGTSMSLSEGQLTSAPATTASGGDALAVAGFPADSVKWALANLDTDFDLVVSGSNSGQNIGDFSALSGTVGAARFAAQQGIPAVAVSQGFVADGGEIVFDVSVAAAVEWIVANRGDYEAGTVSLTSINSPTCQDGGRGVALVPLGVFDGRDALAFDCASVAENPVDDVDAFANGFTAITDLPIQV
jgi:5'-nucleotidase